MLRITHRVGKAGVLVGCGVFVVAVNQASTLRKKYQASPKLGPPAGPHTGLERFVDTFQRLKEEKDDVIDKTAAILRELRTKVKQTIETKTDELVQQKATFTDKVKEQWARLTASLKSGSSNTPKRQKKIKLVLLGDSLVCGVGCDDGIVERSSSSSSTSSSSSSSSQPLTLSGPVLPQIVAKVLSAAMRVDVEWSSIGIVGGTVNDVRNVLLPEMRQKLRGTPVSRKGDTSAAVESVASSSSSSSSGSRHESTASGGEEATVGTTPVAASSSGSGGNGVTRSGYDGPVGNEDEEVFFVVICGVNDLKRTYSQFPNCGPAAFKEQLGKLVVDIQEMGQELRMNCKVFLPAIPVVCGRGDATSPLMVLRPLSTFVEYLGYIWDAQKKAVAIDNEDITTYIDAPSLDKPYATPGHGNFSSDGFHPSPQGYKWWAFHIAESILESNLGLVKLDDQQGP